MLRSSSITSGKRFTSVLRGAKTRRMSRIDGGYRRSSTDSCSLFAVASEDWLYSLVPQSVTVARDGKISITNATSTCFSLIYKSIII